MGRDPQRSGTLLGAAAQASEKVGLSGRWTEATLGGYTRLPIKSNVQNKSNVSGNGLPAYGGPTQGRWTHALIGSGEARRVVMLFDAAKPCTPALTPRRAALPPRPLCAPGDNTHAINTTINGDRKTTHTAAHDTHDGYRHGNFRINKREHSTPLFMTLFLHYYHYYFRIQ